jgi:hypothetical protein
MSSFFELMAYFLSGIIHDDMRLVCPWKREIDEFAKLASACGEPRRG